MLTMIMLLYLARYFSYGSRYPENDTADQDEKMTIGVSVYNLNDAEVRAFRNYFEKLCRHGF